MPLRQKSPDFVELFDQEVQQDPKIIINLLSANFDDSHYLHWSELIRRTPPEGFTQEQWWLGLKVKRLFTIVSVFWCGIRRCGGGFVGCSVRGS